MNSNFLGAGWNFPIQIQNGDIVLAKEGESIGQSISIILGTAPGERMMRPDFGCGIYDMVFAVNDASTAGVVEQQVRRALTVWEPRIDVLSVQASAGGNTEVLLIAIEYRVRSTNNVFNLVYPFYLEGGV